MQKDTIVEISSIVECQKIPEGIRIRLKNHFSPNWKQQKLILLSGTSRNKKLRQKSPIFIQEMSPVSRKPLGVLYSGKIFGSL